MLSELSDDEVPLCPRAGARLLAPGGSCWWLTKQFPRAPRGVSVSPLRFPLRLAAYLASQAQSLSPGGRHAALYFAIELPLMLLVFLWFRPAPARSRSRGLARRDGFWITAAAAIRGTKPWRQPRRDDRDGAGAGGRRNVRRSRLAPALASRAGQELFFVVFRAAPYPTRPRSSRSATRTGTRRSSSRPTTS